MNKPKKVVIAGTKFGELYLNAFIEPHPNLVLAGIISQGSQRSQTLANAFGVPLFQDVSELPLDIDIACVVIRASSIGGAGNLLVEDLLQRKIHVIQEHPVSVNELNRHQSLAQQHGVHYRINSFYASSAAGKSLIAGAQHLSSQTRKDASYGNLTTSRQLLYSTLDLLLQSLGESTKLQSTLLGKQKQFDIINLHSAQGDYLLQLQNYLDPRDPDMHSLAMHRIMLGWNNGYLALADSYGPVTWTPVLHADNHQSDNHSLYQIVSEPEGHYLHQHTTQTLCDNQSQVKDTFESLGPDGVIFTLEQFSRVIDGQACEAGFTIKHQLSVAQLWEHILTLSGQPQEHAISPATRIKMPLTKPIRGRM